MATIGIFNKKGEKVEIKCQDSVGDIWYKMNGDYGPNIFFNPGNKDHMLLTDEEGKSLIISKRFVWIVKT